MKPLMILGSVVGFLIGAGFSLEGNCPWSIVLWRACVAALLAGILARWWGRVWVDGLHSALEERRRARSAPGPQAKTPVKP